MSGIAPQEKKEHVPSQAEIEESMNARVDRMTRTLRVLGAAMVLASGSTFLVQRWDSGNDLLRFGFLVAHSGLLLGAAFFCGKKLEESRSSRIFLWTNVALLPLHFAVLGGLVYSQFSLDGGLPTLPSYAVWQAPSPLAAILAAALALVVLLPTTLIGARVLVRSQAKRMTGALLGLCALLLVPIRHGDWAGLIACIGALGVITLDRRVLRKDFAMRTTEGRLMRGVLWIPPALIAARASLFYDGSGISLGLITACCGLILFLAARDEDSVLSNQRVSLTASLLLAGGCILTLGSLGAYDTVGPLYLLAGSTSLLITSRYARKGNNPMADTGLLSAAAIVIVALIHDTSALTGALAALVGIGIAAHSLLTARVLMLLTGAVNALIGLAVLYEQAIGFERIFNWGSLSALGILAVIGAAVAEKNRESLLAWLRSRQQSEVGT